MARSEKNFTSNADVVDWLIVSGTEVLSDRIWSRSGAEADAFLQLDSDRTALVRRNRRCGSRKAFVFGSYATPPQLPNARRAMHGEIVSANASVVAQIVRAVSTRSIAQWLLMRVSCAALCGITD